jgi:hypothetical protein
MLGGLVECAVWHSHWTNTLYGDRFLILAFLLDWHARSLPNNPRFTGQNLYSLLFMARFSVWLVPLSIPSAKAFTSFTPESLRDTHDPHGVHFFLRQKGGQLLRQLPSNEQSLCRDLEHTFKAYLANEYEVLYKVLMGDDEVDTPLNEGKS